MVEQMVNSKFSKQVLGDCGSKAPSFDKQPLITPQNNTSRDVQNDNRNPISRPLGNFTSQRGTESAVASSRAIPGGILSPPCLQSAGSTVANQQYVYARRKSDAELSNGRNSEKNDRVNPQPQAKIKEPNRDDVSAFAPIPLSSTATSCESLTLFTDPLRKHVNEQPTVVKSDPSLDDTRLTGNQHWRDRFIQLQTYLKHCNSNQDAYVKNECSRRAVELERRYPSYAGGREGDTKNERYECPRKTICESLSFSIDSHFQIEEVINSVLFSVQVFIQRVFTNQLIRVRGPFQRKDILL